MAYQADANQAEIVAALRGAEQRFLAFIAKGQGCWEWTGARVAQGYGVFQLLGRARRAHRMAWALEHGEIPSLMVLHGCDNPPCVNPGHLFLGTAQDNVDDCRVKGRRREPRGELHGMALLNWDQAQQIRRRRLAGERGVALAAEYGVSQATVSLILHGKHWRNAA